MQFLPDVEVIRNYVTDCWVEVYQILQTIVELDCEDLLGVSNLESALWLWNQLISWNLRTFSQDELRQWCYELNHDEYLTNQEDQAATHRLKSVLATENQLNGRAIDVSAKNKLSRTL